MQIWSATFASCILNFALHEQSLNIAWNRRFEVDRLPRDRMRQPHAPGMKRLARHRLVRHAVERVANDRPAARREMHTDLVRPSGHQLASYERAIVRGGRDHLVTRLARCPCLGDDHASSIGGIAPEWKRDAAAGRVGRPLDDSDVLLAYP